MEYALYLMSGKRLPPDNGHYRRIYFGHEFCERRLPGERELARISESCRMRGLALTLVTPYVTERGVARIARLCRWLQRHCPGAEVVVNDVGVLAMIAGEFSGMQPVIGRLLTRQKRDPRIVRLFEAAARTYGRVTYEEQEYVCISDRIPAALREYYQESALNSTYSTRFWGRFGVRRAEIDNLLQGVGGGARTTQMQCSVYIPYGYVTTTRRCLADSETSLLPFDCPVSHCGDSCRNHYAELTHPDLPVPLYQRGNTVFYRSESPSLEQLRSRGIDRIVYQPEIPV